MTNVLYTLVGLFTCHPMATAVNMVTALTTEADNPAINANVQSRKTTTINFIVFLFFNCSKGLNKKFSMSKIIPTCNPETSKEYNV